MLPTAKPALLKRSTSSPASLFCRLAGLCLLLGAAPAWSSPLQLEDALRLAVSQHPAVQQRRNLQDAAKGALDTAKRGSWPSFSGQTGKDYDGKTTVTLRLEQPLWTGGRLTAQIDQATAGVRSAEAALQESQQDILVRTANAYTELGRLESRSASARANVAEHERLRSMIFNRIEQQITANSDGILVSARLAQANAELGQMQLLATRARTTLSQLLGQPVSAITAPTMPSVGVSLLDSAVDAALAFSPTLHRLDAQAQAAAAEVDVRRSQTLPQVLLRHENTSGGLQPSNATYVALEYQTGAGLANLRQVQEAQARHQATLAEQDAVRRNVIETVSAHWADLTSFQSQISDLQAQVQAQAQVHASYVRQYVAGRKNWIELLNAQRKQADAAADLLADGLMLLPQHTGLMLAIAPLWIQAGQQNDAMALLAQGARSANIDPGFHAYYAAQLLRLKRPAEAAEQYRVALRSDANKPEWLLGLGLALHGAGNLPEAVQALRRASQTGGLSAQNKTMVDQVIARLAPPPTS